MGRDERMNVVLTVGLIFVAIGILVMGTSNSLFAYPIAAAWSGIFVYAIGCIMIVRYVRSLAMEP